jgi:hypothetical protein
MSRADYCRIHSLIYHQLEYQERKLTKKISNKSLALLPVKLSMPEGVVSHNEVNHSTANVALLCILQLKDGHKLKIFDPKVLPLILNMLV